MMFISEMSYMLLLPVLTSAEKKIPKSVGKHPCVRDDFYQEMLYIIMID